MVTTAIVIGAWASLVGIVVWLCHRAPVIEYEDTDQIERINRIVGSAKHLREQLDARADEIVRAHGYQWGSCEADDLAAVVWDGEPYDDAIKRIMRRKVKA